MSASHPLSLSPLPGVSPLPPSPPSFPLNPSTYPAAGFLPSVLYLCLTATLYAHTRCLIPNTSAVRMESMGTASASGRGSEPSNDILQTVNSPPFDGGVWQRGLGELGRRCLGSWGGGDLGEGS
jgi:hypothetical protein